MFNNTVKARLFKYCDLGYSTLVQLKSWLRHSKTFNSFSPEEFSNPTLKMAVATSPNGEVVCMTPIQTCWMVNAFCVNPAASSIDARIAGDAIDAELARQAQKHGVSKLLIVVPKDHPSLKDNDLSDFNEVRIFERKFNQLSNSGGIGISAPLHVTPYFN